MNILLQNWSISPSVNTRVWLLVCCPASAPLWGSVDQSPRGSAHNPQPLQAPAEQIKAWHRFEITSLCVTCKTRRAVSRKSTTTHFKERTIRAAGQMNAAWRGSLAAGHEAGKNKRTRPSVPSEKQSWQPLIIRLSTQTFPPAKNRPSFFRLFCVEPTTEVFELTSFSLYDSHLDIYISFKPGSKENYWSRGNITGTLLAYMRGNAMILYSPSQIRCCTSRNRCVGVHVWQTGACDGKRDRAKSYKFPNYFHVLRPDTWQDSSLCRSSDWYAAAVTLSVDCAH